MGQVYKALHSEMQREVALKTLKSSLPVTSDSAQRFQREVQAAARLVHPNVVVAHDAGEVDGVRFLVTEYVEGQNLSTLVRQSGAMPLARAVDLIQQAAEGLKYAHQRGVVHRDVKPGNLLLSDEGVVKVLDLGLARFSLPHDQAADLHGEPLTSAGMVMGTADYMAPEQASETRTADERADIYSLGCTLHFLLTAERVFPAPTVWQTLAFHHEKTVPSLSGSRDDIPLEFDAVFQQMLAKNPADRYQSMRNVIEALSPFASAVARDQRRAGLPPDSAADGSGSEFGNGSTEVAGRDGIIRERILGSGEPARRSPHSANSDETLLLPSARWRRRGRKPLLIGGLLVVTIAAIVSFSVSSMNPEQDDTTDSVADPGTTPGAVDGTVGGSGLSGRTDFNNVAYERDELISAIWATDDEAKRERLRDSVRGLPSPADALRPEDIPPEELADATRFDEFLNENLVAVLGSSHSRHWNSVSSVVFTTDSKYLITGSADGTVVVRDAGTGDARHFVEFPAGVADLAVSPEGKLLAIGLFDGSVELWDTSLSTRSLQKQFNSSYTYSVAFSPDGRWLVVGTLQTLFIQNRGTGEWRTFPEFSHTSSMAFCDKNVLAMVHEVDAKVVKLLDLDTGTVKRTLPVNGCLFLQVTADGKHLVGRSSGGSLSVWDTETWEERPTPELTGLWSLAAHPSKANQIVASFNQINGAPGPLAVIDLTAGAVVHELATPEWNTVPTLAFSPDGRRLATGSQQGTISLWDAQTWARLDPEPEHRHAGYVASLDVSRVGDRLASASDAGTVTLWDLHERRAIRAVDASSHVGSHKHGAVAFERSGKRFAFYDEAASVKLLNAADGSPAGWALRPSPGDVIHSLVFAGEPEHLFAGLSNGSVLEIDPLTRSRLRELPENSASGNTESLGTDRGRQSLLAVTNPRISQPSGTVRLFDLSATELTEPEPAGSIRDGYPPVAFSADEQFVISGDNYNKFTTNS